MCSLAFRVRVRARGVIVWDGVGGRGGGKCKSGFVFGKDGGERGEKDEEGEGCWKWC